MKKNNNKNVINTKLSFDGLFHNNNNNININNNSNKKSKKKNNVLQSKKDIKGFEIKGFNEILLKKNKNLTSRNFNYKIYSNSERVSSKNSTTNIIKNKNKLNSNKIGKLFQLLYNNNNKF